MFFITKQEDEVVEKGKLMEWPFDGMMVNFWGQDVRPHSRSNNLALQKKGSKVATTATTAPDEPPTNHPHRGTNRATAGAKHTARGPGDTERVHQVTQQAEPHQYHNITKLADKYAPPSFTDIYQGTEGLVQV